MATNFGNNMRAIRESRKMTLEEMANFLGTTKQALSRYELGQRTPKITVAAAFAEKLGVPLVELAGYEDSSEYQPPLPVGLMPLSLLRPQPLPMIGAVAAGEPILADELYDVYVDSPVKADYALRVQGDSMEPTYLDGDIVYIRVTPDVTDGTVAVVLIDDSACMKHVYHIPNGVQLVSDNPKYPPMIRIYPEYDVIRILGAVVGYTRMYDKE